MRKRKPRNRKIQEAIRRDKVWTSDQIEVVKAVPMSPADREILHTPVPPGAES